MVIDMKAAVLNNRLVFADFAKLFAMFVVTWGHCAQCLSGITYPELFGKPGVLIAFHMPLFMIVSGYFIYPEHIREKRWPAYVAEKFQRLVIPALVWYACYCLLTIHKPHLMGCVGFYWFLTSMFLSFLLISVVVRVNKNDNMLLYLASVLIVVFLPFSSFLHVNFMYPLMMGGMFLRKAINRCNGAELTTCAVILFLSGAFLLYHWDISYSVYLTPFDSTRFSPHNLYALFVRLLTGFVISSFFVVLFLLADSKKCIQVLSKYGKYTLVMYTASFIINGIFGIILSHLQIRVTQTGLLELSSCMWSIATCILCVLLAQLLEKNGLTKRLFLGIVYH